MISKVKGGYIVKSESCKRLSRVYPTKGMAKSRLREIEYFKSKGK